jgi:hypothetical protein
VFLRLFPWQASRAPLPAPPPPLSPLSPHPSPKPSPFTAYIQDLFSPRPTRLGWLRTKRPRASCHLLPGAVQSTLRALPVYGLSQTRLLSPCVTATAPDTKMTGLGIRICDTVIAQPAGQPASQSVS